MTNDPTWFPSSDASRRRTDVTVVGTGLMGAAIARVLLSRGRTVTVWNRSASRATPLVEMGAQLGRSVADALHASPVAIMVILDYSNVRALLENAREVGPLGDVINLTTGTPDQAAELGAWAERRGVALLDGVIRAYPSQMGDTETMIAVAGRPDVWERQAPILRAVAGASRYLGDEPRLANALEHMVLSFVVPAYAACLEAVRLGQAEELPSSEIYAALSRSVVPVEHFLQRAMQMIETGDYATTEATIDTWAPAVAAITASAKALGVQTRQMASASESLRGAQEAGLGALDFVGLHHHLRASSL